MTGCKGTSQKYLQRKKGFEMYHFAKCLFVSHVVATLVIASASGQELCVDLRDPAGNFVPRGYCLPAHPGEIGDATSIQFSDVSLTVLGDPDGRFDIIVPLENSITASVDNPISYSTSLMWPSASVSRDSIRVRELGVNFKPDATSPRFAPLTNLMAGDEPAASFSWIEDPNNPANVIGWTVSQELTAIPELIGGTISHYHMTTWDLPAGTPVFFSKEVSGGEVVAVVPEPSTHALIMLGAIAACKFRRKMLS
ncbi:MAG: PEP-CTERM sorting domain-containing protein [Planctomycetales bacterium]|nr:PEP-CTERM sorting domain-containing protein [Planctomycetales bacterium]